MITYLQLQTTDKEQSNLKCRTFSSLFHFLSICLWHGLIPTRLIILYKQSFMDLFMNIFFGEIISCSHEPWALSLVSVQSWWVHFSQFYFDLFPPLVLRNVSRWDIVESLEFFKVHIKYSLWNTCPDSGRRQRYYKPRNEDPKRLLLSSIMLVSTLKYVPTQPGKVYADINVF